MAVTIGTGRTGASVSAVKLRISVAVVNPEIAVSASVAAAEIEYILMAVNAFLDVKGLYPLIKDPVATSETVAKGFVTRRTDHFSQSDHLEPFLLGKGLREDQETFETHTFDMTRGLADTAHPTEIVRKGLTTSRADSFTQSDLSRNHLSKPFKEEKWASDGNQAAYTYASIDYFAADYVTEYLPQFHVYKGLTELLDATDDFFGETNADDDETMAFTKVLNDVPATLDLLRFVLNTGRSDSFATSDTRVNAFGKARTDAAATSDAKTLSSIKSAADLAAAIDALYSVVNKPLADSFSTSDTDVLAVGKALSDSAIHSDANTKAVSKALADSSAMSDAKTLLAGKALTDLAATSDAKAFNFSKSLSDSVTPTDDFLGAANADDDETMLFATTRNESVSSSDSKALAAGKNTSDTASSSDSGSLYMTDYCDISYFGGAYVGTYTTF